MLAHILNLIHNGSGGSFTVFRFHDGASHHNMRGGIGIPEEEQAKIFGRFYRGKQSAGVDGVGIGLYLTRDIVNKQNGYIKVASDEKGTIFRCV